VLSIAILGAEVCCKLCGVISIVCNYIKIMINVVYLN
jgi:hypothetical protein